MLAPGIDYYCPRCPVVWSTIPVWVGNIPVWPLRYTVVPTGHGATPGLYEVRVNDGWVVGRYAQGQAELIADALNRELNRVAHQQQHRKT